MWKPRTAPSRAAALTAAVLSLAAGARAFGQAAANPAQAAQASPTQPHVPVQGPSSLPPSPQGQPYPQGQAYAPGQVYVPPQGYGRGQGYVLVPVGSLPPGAQAYAHAHGAVPGPGTAGGQAATGQPYAVTPQPGVAAPAGGAPEASATDAMANAMGATPEAAAPDRPDIKPTVPPLVPQGAADAMAAANEAQLKTIDGEIARLQSEQSQAKGDPGLTRVRQDAAAAEASADAFAKARQAEVSALNDQLKRYSEKSGRPRPRLSPEEERVRAELLARRDQAAKLVRAAEQEAAQASGVYNAIATKRRTAFASRIFERTDSPLEADFWSSLAGSLGPDMVRLERMAGDIAGAAMDAREPRGIISLVISLALGFLLVGPVRRFARRLVRRRAVEAAQESQDGPAPAATLRPGLKAQQEAAADLGRSAHALGAALIDTLAPGLAAVVVNLGLTWGDLVSTKGEALAHTLVIAVFWGAAIVALARQLAGAPEERLLPVGERLAARMRVLPWLVAVITGAGLLITRINMTVGASLAATIAANSVISLAYAGVASLILVALGADGERSEEDADVRQPGRVLLSLALSGAILVTVAAVLAGFSTFAHLLAAQIFWISVLAALAYLLLRFTADVVAELFAPRGWIGRVLMSVLNLRMPVVNQIGVLVAAGLQIVIVLGAISLALTPYGANGDLLSGRLGHLGEAVHVGSITISPNSVMAGVASLVIGLILVHVVERWVTRRYLPVTDWDSGVRNSVATGVRYLGVGLAILWALAAAGLGFKQIALVASALSVGIGFGLQQIVQNFVSGLILLVERPVKVGDWVNLGGVEGDVQRIRVRSTEIRTFDKTTLIVPNSDLITKQVQNKTLGDPRGRVRLEVSVGAPGDAPRARDALIKMLQDDDAVLETPAPVVVIDSLTASGSVNYVLFAYVASQRDVTRTKSRLYEKVLALFAQEKIGFIGGPSTNIMEPGPEMRSFVGELTSRLKAAATEPQAQDTREAQTPAQTQRPAT